MPARTFSILLFVLVVMNAFIFYIFSDHRGEVGRKWLVPVLLAGGCAHFFDTALASSLLQRANG